MHDPPLLFLQNKPWCRGPGTVLTCHAYVQVLDPTPNDKWMKAPVCMATRMLCRSAIRNVNILMAECTPVMCDVTAQTIVRDISTQLALCL